MQRTNWTDRKFEFNLPQGWMDNTLERLNGALPRLKDLCSALSEEQVAVKPGGKWSIKEHIGHLHDLELLHLGRIDDFLARKETLRAADMSNARTEKASHNQYALNELVTTFERGRHELIKRLRELDVATQSFASLHPRLQINMKPVDMAAFVCEHDDHHLTSIRHILTDLGK